MCQRLTDIKVINVTVGTTMPSNLVPVWPRLKLLYHWHSSHSPGGPVYVRKTTRLVSKLSYLFIKMQSQDFKLSI